MALSRRTGCPPWLSIVFVTQKDLAMSISLASSDPSLAGALGRMAPDGAISPSEMKGLRDAADARAWEATNLDPTKAQVALGLPLILLLRAADDIVECMNELTTQARRKKLSRQKRDALKGAIEHQLAYVVAHYQASVQRL